MEECKDCKPANEPEPGQVLRFKGGGQLLLVVTPEAGGLSGKRRMVNLKDGNIWSSKSLYGTRDEIEFEAVDCCFQILD